MPGSLTGTGGLSEPATAARDATELTARSVLEACAQRGASLVPCLSSLVAEVKEALDPESFMFDAESAPYRDQQWAWRAMRLMRVQDAKAFESITRESAIPQVMAGLAGVPVPEGDVKSTEAAHQRRVVAEAARKRGQEARAALAAAEAAATAAAAARSSSASAPISLRREVITTVFPAPLTPVRNTGRLLQPTKPLLGTV